MAGWIEKVDSARSDISGRLFLAFDTVDKLGSKCPRGLSCGNYQAMTYMKFKFDDYSCFDAYFILIDHESLL